MAESTPVSDRLPVALIVLDGWGYAEPGPGNAIDRARTPVMDGLMADYPWVLLEASGEAVGLPEGVMGNSEVGHLTMGAGRVVYQDLTRINKSIEDGSFFDNDVLIRACREAIESGGALHLMGLLSDGGVHADIRHVEALVELARRQGVRRLFVHPFMDGRDTSPVHGKDLLEELEAVLHEKDLGAVATVSGRYYAMDRDLRWDRIERAYRVLVCGEGPSAPDALSAIRSSYESDVTDEFVVPTVIDGSEAARISDGDSVIFYNFRPDRARQLTRALTQPDFDEFERTGGMPDIHFVSFTEYDASFDVPVAVPDAQPEHVLAEVLSRAGLSQLHIAETEKYAHVTFFFNGGREAPFEGEDRKLIPSPRDVATYDQKPEMSCHGVAESFEELMDANGYDFVVLNFANPDMVGHTGNMEATIEALEHVDGCLERVIRVLRRHGAHVLVTADHGNAERLLDADGRPDTAHTVNPVPLVYLDHDAEMAEGLGLSDLAPTILGLLGLDVPDEMTGRPICAGT